MFVFVARVGQYLSEKLLLLAFAVNDFLFKLSNFHFVVVDQGGWEINLNQVLEVVQGLTGKSKQLINGVIKIVEE